MSGNFVVSMLFKADSGPAKAGLNAIRQEMQGVGAEARKARDAVRQEAVALDDLAAAATRAALGQADLAAKARSAQVSLVLPDHEARIAAATAGVAGLGQAMDRLKARALTAAGGMTDAVGGLNAALDGTGAALLREAEATRQWQGALDSVRASFNPLFAASRQYEAQLERIADAERLGAISAREAAAARARAAAQLGPVGPAAPVGPRGGATGGAFVTGNLAAQGNDIMMMAMAGQNPLQLALQQGTQVSQVLNGLEKGTSVPRALAAGFLSMVNPISLVTMGIIALGAVGLQALSGLVPKVKSFDEAMGELSGAVQSFDKHLATARRSIADLGAEFGSAASAAQGLSQAMADIDRRDATRSARAVVNAVQREQKLWLPDPSWRDPNPNADTNAQLFDARRASDRQKMRGLFDLDRTARSDALIDPVLDAMTRVDQGKTMSDRIAAVQQLRTAWETAAAASGGYSVKEDAALTKLIQAAEEMARLTGLQENAAGRKAAGEMADDLGRQAAMAAAVAKYGQDSAAVRMLELQQQRRITALKLEALGIDAKGPDGLRIMAEMQVAHEARERGIRDERSRAHDAQLSALTREGQLIGATTEQRLRANAIAEAQLEADRRNLSPLERMLEVTRAITRASAEAANARAKFGFDLQTERMTDALDAQIGASRDPLSKATLEGERERIRLVREGVNADDAAAKAAAVRARSLAEAITQARGEIATISDEVAVRRQVAVQVAAGTIAAGDASAAIQRELQLRPLVAAAARAEGDEKRRLTEIVTGLRLAHELQAAEERRQAQNDYLRSAAERIQQARLELALVGQTATVRARVLALAQAERDIHAQGLTGDAASHARRQAGELAEINRQIEAQGDAWQAVQSAGEAAIDGVLEKLRGGDVKGAFASLLDELNSGFFDLAVRNPLKNALMGGNLGTLDSVGGLSGIWARLSGKAPIDETALARQGGSPVRAMQIAAAQVTINAAALGLGGGSAGLLAGLPGVGGGMPQAANMNAAPTMAGQEVRSLLTSIGVGGGTRADAISHLDAALAEPLAAMVAEAQRLFGASAVQINSGYRSVERQKQLWDAALAKYGSAAEARKWVAPPGRSNHNHGLAADLRYGSPEVQRWFHQQAPAYGLSYRMSNEPWHIEPIGGRNAARGAGEQVTASAAQAMTGFASAAKNATADVSQLGDGMGGLGKALAQAATGGGSDNLVMQLVGLGAKALKIPGFATGGATGGSDPSRVAGVVHEQEYVFSAAAVRRIGAGNLEALHRGSLKGFRSGGYVGTAPAIATPSAAPQVSVQVHNHTGQTVRQEETTDAGGNRQITMVIGDAVGAAISQPGNPAQRALQQTFGARRKAIVR